MLRDDGLSYGEYLEQLTYLLFLKMADEQYEQLGGRRVVPAGCATSRANWTGPTTSGWESASRPTATPSGSTTSFGEVITSFVLNMIS